MVHVFIYPLLANIYVKVVYLKHLVQSKKVSLIVSSNLLFLDIEILKDVFYNAQSKWTQEWADGDVINVLA